MIIRNCKAYLGGLQVNPQSAALRLMTVRECPIPINVATPPGLDFYQVIGLLLSESSLQAL